MRPLRVFLCHSSQDKPTVRELYKKLHAEPWIQPWLDEEELYPGQDWNMEIEKAVEAADAIIVCLTKNSINKEGYVQRELRTVLDFADYKPEGTLYIIPVRLEECEPPRRLRAWQYADYFEGQRDRAFQRLLVSLKRRADTLGSEIKKPEEPIVSTPVMREIEEKTKKEIPAKPFTKLLDPSTLSPQKVLSTKADKQYEKKRLLYGLGGFALIAVFVLGLYTLFSPLSELDKATLTPTFLEYTETPKPPTAISATFTSTSQPIKTPSPAPTLGVGLTMISEKDGMTLVYVPEGEFIMGSVSYPDAQPVHRVFLDGYWLDQTEVTNAMYARCVDAGQCNPGSENDNDSTNYPVTSVSWYDANDYCKYVGRRLPTEAEWEKAARGENAYTYPWGNIDPQGYLLNYNGNDGIYNDVGSYPAGASVYGALDMAGSVSEWVSSLYAPYPYDASDGREDLSSFEDRVMRGSSTMSINRDIPSALRGGEGGDPTLSNFILGFRCASSP